MVSTLAWVALGLALLGVVGSVVPLLPGAALSLAGVALYWWSTGYVDPPLAVLLALVAVAVATMLVDLFAGAVAARAGGASTTTTALAAVVGVLLVFVAGPLGIVVGVAGTVFVVEYNRNRDVDASARTALYATVGVLGSALVQVTLTATMFVALALVVFL